MKKTVKQNQNQIRMNDSLKTRIHKYRVRLEKETGLPISFSSVVRLLIERGLAA